MGIRSRGFEGDGFGVLQEPLHIEYSYFWAIHKGSFPPLPEGKLNELNMACSAEEVWQALKQMGPWKASGSDGLQAGFYQRTWGVVGEGVSSTVLKCLEGERLPQNMADALLVLIPKTEKPESIKQFRPISLCNVTFKLVTKVIVNKIKNILEDLVSPNQCSFVPRQQIGDNIIICQELIDALKHKKGKEGGMIIKVDLEKAYDRLEWRFIRETLHDIGLPQRMIETIVDCVSNARFKLVWIGECT